MKKTSFTTLLLAVFPLLTVFITSSPDGVMVFDGSATVYYTWLQPVAQSGSGWCAPAAALLNYLIFGLAVIYMVMKKSWCLKAILWLSAIAACIAALPVVSQGDVKVIPNVLGIIFLAAEWIAAALINKNEQKNQSQEPKGKRLKCR